MKPTGTGEFRPTKAHVAWAAAVLGLDAALPADALRAAALKLLAANEFAMWRQAELAVRVLAGSAEAAYSPGDRALLAEVEEVHLRQVIDRFCRKFFKLPVDERLRHLKALRVACAPYPVLRLRLTQLQSGAQVEMPEITGEDADQGQLVDAVRRHFLAWPVDAARIRREDVDGMPRARWKSAAWRLYHEHAAVHGLAPQLISVLNGQSYVPDWAKQAAARTTSRQRNNGQAGQKPAKQRSLAPYLLLGLVIGLVRFFYTTTDRPPRVEAPQAQQQYNAKSVNISADQLEQLRNSLKGRESEPAGGRSMQELLDIAIRNNKMLGGDVATPSAPAHVGPIPGLKIAPDAEQLLEAARRDNQKPLEDFMEESRTAPPGPDRTFPKRSARRPDERAQPSFPQPQFPRSPQPQLPQRPVIPRPQGPSIPQPARPAIPSAPGGPRP